MSNDESPHPIYSYGRATQWVVLATIVGSILYSLWKMVVNWTFITV